MLLLSLLFLRENKDFVQKKLKNILFIYFIIIIIILFFQQDEENNGKDQDPC